MVKDFNFGIEVAVAPIVREADGLAMSSRNVYLTAKQRKAATSLNRALLQGQTAFSSGERDSARLIEQARTVIGAEPVLRLQYLELGEQERLATPVTAST